jgi:tetratricopeptide (TPR) repeat protein
MSPEQALAKRVVVDHRSDVYSLGVTLYELLTLQPAYSAEDRQELLKQIAFEEPAKPRRINARIPQDLETIILKAIEKNPADRYATALQLADDLRRYIGSEPIKARPATMLQRAKKWSRRHAGVFWTASFAALAILTLGIIGLAASNAVVSRERNAKQAALVDLSAAYDEKSAALKSAEDNLVLALKALDEVYLQGIGQDRLLLTKSVQDAPEVRDRVPFTDDERRLLERGLKFYEQFAVQNAQRPEVRFQVAQANRRIGDICVSLGERERARTAFTAAVALLNKLIEEEPVKAAYWELLGRIYFKLNKVETSPAERAANYERAADAYTKWIGLEPENATAYIERMDTYLYAFEQGLLHKGIELAVPDGKRAVELEPNNARAHFRYARVLHVRANRNPLAIKHAEEAVRLDPNAWQAHLALATVVQHMGQYGRELQAARRALDLEANESTYGHLVAILHANGHEKDALAYAEEGIRVCRAPQCFHVRAQIAAQRGNLELAIADYGSVIEMGHASDQTRLFALNERGRLYLRLGQYEAAIKDFDAMTEVAWQNTFPFAPRAAAHLLLGHVEQALADLEKALQTNSLNRLPPIDATLAAKFRDSVVQQGLQRLAKKAASSERPEVSLLAIAILFTRLGMNQEAADALEQVIEINPTDAGALNEYAWNLAINPNGTARDGRRAVKFATRACELTNYQDANVVDTLAAAYAQAGDFEAAVKWSAISIELSGHESWVKHLEQFRQGKPWREE